MPVIYADVNVYRYLAYDELHITEPDHFIWCYSHVHLDEMHRGRNIDALDGMTSLEAVEINDVPDENFKSVGNSRIMDNVDPKELYARRLYAISGIGDTDDFMIEHLLRIFGADNFAELTMTPTKPS